MKYVATVHDILPFNEKFYDKYFHKKLYGLADSIILQAPGNVNRFAELFPELKEKYNVMRVPCLVINQDKVTFGKKNIQQLLEVIGTGNSNEI